MSAETSKHSWLLKCFPEWDSKWCWRILGRSAPESKALCRWMLCESSLEVESQRFGRVDRNTGRYMRTERRERWSTEQHALSLSCERAWITKMGCFLQLQDCLEKMGTRMTNPMICGKEQNSSVQKQRKLAKSSKSVLLPTAQCVKHVEETLTAQKMQKMVLFLKLLGGLQSSVGFAKSLVQTFENNLFGFRQLVGTEPGFGPHLFISRKDKTVGANGFRSPFFQKKCTQPKPKPFFQNRPHHSFTTSSEQRSGLVQIFSGQLPLSAIMRTAQRLGAGVVPRVVCVICFLLLY